MSELDVGSARNPGALIGVLPERIQRWPGT